MSRPGGPGGPGDSRDPGGEESPGRLRTLLAVSIGNALEWFDWGSYVVFAAVLSGQFFAASDPATGLLQTLAVFAVGFFFRPLGGALIGGISDRHGRRAALTLSVMLMAGGSLLIAITPSQAQIGVAAPVLLVIARAAQGLSAGGEVTAMSTYVNEIAPAGRRGRYSSVIYISTTVGTLAATLLLLGLRAVLSTEQLSAWGWRIPFALGALLAGYGWYLRRRIRETPVFGAGERVARPSLVVLREHPRAVARVVGFTVGSTVVYYTFAVYLPLYAQHEHAIAATPALWAAVGAQLVFIISLPAFGVLSDRLGRRPLLLVFGLGFTLLTPLLFTLVGSSPWSLAAVMTAALLLFACCAAAAPPAMLELFPTSVRSSGIGLPYSLTVAVFGGTAPYLIEYLSRHDLDRWFPRYVVLLCLVSTVTFCRCPETKDADLTGATPPAHPLEETVAR